MSGKSSIEWTDVLPGTSHFSISSHVPLAKAQELVPDS